MHETNSHNFTLIVPTHNRHHYLKRSIAFFKNLEADVIYCDSSTYKYTGLMSENMSYLHLSGKKFAEKVLIALDGVKTDFVAMCADDDFILYSALYKGISVLEKENGFKTVVGKYIAFHEEFDGKFYKITKSLPSDINLNASDNAKIFFSNYHQILWAMYQKNILATSFDIIDKANFTNDNFIELVVGSIVCYTGGVKFINEVWGVRERTSDIHWANEHKEIHYIYEDKNIREDFEKIKAALDPLTFDGYSNLVLQSYLTKYKIQKNKYFKEKIKLILPKTIISLIRAVRRRIILKRLEVAIANEAPELEKMRNILNN